MGDRELLQQYQQTGSEAAFRALVERYAGLVFAVARRRTGDHSVAEDVAQSVFLILAAKASRLRAQGELASWLHRTTLFEASNAARRESARQRRMEEFAEMSATMSDPNWSRISPVLDEAIDRLNDRDRSAVLLRFYEGLSFRELGVSLGKTEAAARQQVSRALGKLSGILRRRGVTTTAAVLSVGMTSHLSATVPAGAAAAISQGALASAAAVGKTNVILNSIQAMTYAKTKTAVVVALLAAIPIGLQWQQNLDLKRELAAGRGAQDQSAMAKSNLHRGGSFRTASFSPVRDGARSGRSDAQGVTGSPRAIDWERALYEQDPVVRAQRIADLLAEFDSRAAHGIAELFFGDEAKPEFESEARLFVRAWAQRDGAAAVAYLEEQGQAGAANASMLAALGGWASSDPQAARSWAEAIESDTLREDLLFGVIDGWALLDFRAAADYAETRPRSEARTRFIDLLFRRSMAAGDLPGAQNWFAGISSDAHNEVFKQRAFERIVDAMLFRDPAAAAQWIASQAGEAFVSREAIDMTAMKLAANAPENALQWLASMRALDESVSAGTQGRVMGQWADSDPEAAGQWLSGRLDAPGFDAMARSYSSSVAQFDGAAALEWARVIEDPDQRDAAVMDVARQRLRAEGEGAVAALRAEGLSEEQVQLAQTPVFEEVVMRSFDSRHQNRLSLDLTGYDSTKLTENNLLNSPVVSFFTSMGETGAVNGTTGELHAHFGDLRAAQNELRWQLDETVASNFAAVRFSEAEAALVGGYGGSGSQALPAGHAAVHGQNCASCHRGN